jgi:hypothetical protein
MNNPFMILLTFAMFYITFLICYLLALSFIGISQPFKKLIIPILLFSIIGYISKIYFNASASTHTVVVVLTCTGLLYLYSKINIILSIIGSLLSFTTLTFGSLLLACPFFNKLGYSIPLKFNGLKWLSLALLELIVPLIVLVLIKKNKFSLMKYFYTMQ